MDVTKVALSMLTDYRTFKNPSLFTTNDDFNQIWPLCRFWMLAPWTDDGSLLPQIDPLQFDPCFLISKARKKYFWDKHETVWPPS